MNNNPTSFEPEKQPAASPGPVRKSVLILTAIIALGAVALIVVASKHAKPGEHTSDGAGVENKPVSELPDTKPVAESVASPTAPTTAATPLPDPDRALIARQLIKSLSEINLQPGELTPEKADKWKQDLEQLIEQGSATVPPLREFFQSHADMRFDSGSGTNLLGEPSLRIAFMKVLFDVPTPDNVDLQEEVLRTTTDPAEVALLARQMEAQEPGKYRDLIISTAQESLTQAKSGRWPGQNTGPLIKILKQYGETAK